MIDKTWPVCKGCKFRSRSLVLQDSDGKEVPAYVCSIGIDRDRSPDSCPWKVEVGPWALEPMYKQ